MMTHNTNHPAAALHPARAGLLLVSLLLLAGPGRLAAQQQAYFTANGRNVDIAALQKEVESMMDEVGIPAVSLAVIDDNRVVFSHAYGYKRAGQKDKVDDKSVFEACSLSKSFLVFVAHQLADEGKLDLDRPIHQYLAEKRLEDDPRYTRITPRMILGHASGIENWQNRNDPNKLEILENPGERYVYSGAGYNYLAEAIEVILNQPYAGYIEERILKPFRLKNTYTYFKKNKIRIFHRTTPDNYAIGHDPFGREMEKWIHDYPDAASGANTVAEDYAKLIIATFNQKNLSANSFKRLLMPVVPFYPNDSSVFYGPGFEIIYAGKDTIISQAGSNAGFKARLLYSPGQKRGLVFFTNGDRGEWLAARLNALTARLDVEAYLDKLPFEQYPNHSVRLMKLYREQHEGAMFAAIESMQSRKENISAKTFTSLALDFMDYNAQVSKKLLDQGVAAYPRSADACQLLGRVHTLLDDHEGAYQCFTRAKELDAHLPETDRLLRECKEKMADAARRRALVAAIGGQAETTVQTEDYLAMKGIKLQQTSDQDGGKHVGFIDTNDWMSYQVNVASAGTYAVAFRVTSLKGGGRLQLQSGTETLATVDVPATHGWSNWTTLTTSVELPAGPRTLTLYAAAGGLTINWMKFSPAPVISSK